jgi:arylsulfatase A-like enzyme
MADDMGYGDLGCYGATKIPTPNVDRLAAEGMRFTNAHASSAVCTPSRYSVLTGRYCWRTRQKRGVGTGFSLPLIDPARLTVASMLRSQGYRTAAIGKWHVGLEWQLKDEYIRENQCKFDWDKPHLLNTNVVEDLGAVDYHKPIIGGPTSLGFDYFFGIAGSLDMPPYCFIENERTVGIPSEEKHPYHAQQKKGLMVPGWKDEEVDVHFAQKAMAFIEQNASEHPEQPFFLYLTPSAPHRPCLAPDFLMGSSQAGARGDMVCVVDWVLGEVMQTLERLDLSGDTLIFLTSDNGARPADVDGETYGHKTCGDLRGYKGDIWEGGHRIPLVARWPGRIPAGSRSDITVCLSDLLATCAAILGTELPANAGEDSLSILPTLRGEEASPAAEREALVHHSVFGTFAVRRDRWKLIAGTGSGGFSEPCQEETGPAVPPGQLYDMVADIQESNNLWSQEEAVVSALSETLVRIRRQGFTD